MDLKVEIRKLQEVEGNLISRLRRRGIGDTPNLSPTCASSIRGTPQFGLSVKSDCRYPFIPLKVMMGWRSGQDLIRIRGTLEIFWTILSCPWGCASWAGWILLAPFAFALNVVLCWISLVELVLLNATGAGLPTRQAVRILEKGLMYRTFNAWNHDQIFSKGLSFRFEIKKVSDSD